MLTVLTNIRSTVTSCIMNGDQTRDGDEPRDGDHPNGLPYPPDNNPYPPDNNPYPPGHPGHPDHMMKVSSTYTHTHM